MEEKSHLETLHKTRTPSFDCGWASVLFLFQTLNNATKENCLLPLLMKLENAVAEHLPAQAPGHLGGQHNRALGFEKKMQHEEKITLELCSIRFFVCLFFQNSQSFSKEF